MGTSDDLHRALAVPPEDLAAARRVAHRHADVDEGTAAGLLWDASRGVRLVGLLLLVERFRTGSPSERAMVVEDHLAAMRAEQLDSRELVDVGAERIIGEWYLDRSRNPLFAHAKSDVVWERRMALVATLAFVRRGEATTALDLAGRLVRERGDEVQSAIGWVLREVGKRADHRELVAFLEGNASRLGREALVWATEHLPPSERDRFRA